MLAAVACCTRLRELWLGFEGPCKEHDDAECMFVHAPPPQQLMLLSSLRSLCRLDLVLSQVMTTYPYAELVKQLTAFTWLRHLRLSVFSSQHTWDAPTGGVEQQEATHVEQPTADVWEALPSLALQKYLQSLELEVLSPSTAKHVGGMPGPGPSTVQVNYCGIASCCCTLLSLDYATRVTFNSAKPCLQVDACDRQLCTALG